ncbi:hypothetical protein PQX77_010375 [Marasmius sp. AFHP31]|nr:hypothetical protein PQX77_010375 [Marasmius sp. AFHP31]
MFHSASHTNIEGGSFNIVHGNQNNNHYYCQNSQASSECRLVRIQPGEEWKGMLYQEYERIPIWRINLLRTLYHAKVCRRHIGTFQKDDGPEAGRVVEIASVVDRDGRNESKPLLAVKYTGRHAQKVFKEDCDLFSRQRAANFAQLRAFNDSDISIIIFNEELVPLGHFLEHNKYSMQAQCYLRLGYEKFQWAHSVLKDSNKAEDKYDYKVMENGEMRTPDIETWLTRENLYYYSYDPEGGSAITEEEHISLGLPPLISHVDTDYLQWDNNVYNFMEKWQKAKGFDYTTVDFAKSLGIPDILANLQGERSFEDLTDSPDILEADGMDVDSGEVTHTRETCLSSGLPEEVEDDRMDLD